MAVALRYAVELVEDASLLTALDALTGRSLLNDEDARILSAIRNAYNHNKYPAKGTDVKVNVMALPKLTEDLLRIFSDTGNNRVR